MNLEKIQQPLDGRIFPPPLSLKRNGYGSEFNVLTTELLSSGAELVPNADWNGEYFGASIRSGPFKLNK